MILFIQSIILCLIFTILILPAQYKNPLSQFASYPVAIKKRVYELPQYQEFITSIEHKNWKRKIVGALIIAILLAIVAYFTGKRTFETAFVHVFFLFLAINLYDLVVLDLIIFCHSKKLMIPGTEDMEKEYHNPVHHIVGTLKGCIIGTVIAALSASFIFLVQLFKLI